MANQLKLAPAKRERMIEPNRPTWLASTKNELITKGFGTTGSEALDMTLKMPNARLGDRDMDSTIHPDDVPVCQVCEKEITTEVIDGVVKGARCWANMCPTCHRTSGIGLGTGRGQRYMLVSELETRDQLFVKVEG